ncbi:DUF1552 domain-containing protein [Pelagicoccus mobilis]|uniref:DUF1552 domain-containing protein n=1 Tax=Pelagicoccus mobilis TaxID=415221 RepID=A0A934VP01_9BACT|nr:DUF1552 domain-containing protein [Pelagicoccus mobilis]MBK1875300.1 DUF1552 domain-containing protein [Pelagicoccus mobilis]
MSRVVELNRRQFLRGASGMIALPLLQSLPLATAASKSVAPRQCLVCVGTALGMYPREWHPNEVVGRTPKLLEPMNALREHFTVISGLDHGVNGGHKATPAFLSGVYQPEFVGDSIVVRNQITLDQLAAKTLCRDTRFHSLQLGASPGQPTQTLSWDENGVPLLPESDPIKVFNRLFVDDVNPQAASRSMDFKRSVLDLVADDARLLQKEVAYEDREKLEAYFSSIRDVEKRVARQQEWVNTPKPGVPPLLERATTFHENLDLIFELTALALQHDSTRVITVELPQGGLPIILGENQLSGYHGQSHHGKDPEVVEELIEIELMHMNSLAKFISRLDGTHDGEASLLDRTQVLFGSGLGNGSSHSNKNLPVLLAGGGLKHGRDLEFEEGKGTLSNLYVTMLQRLGIERETFAKSTGNLNAQLV